MDRTLDGAGFGPSRGAPGAAQGGRRAAPAARDGAPPEPPLPALREDLSLLPAAPGRDGSPAWMIHDPVGNRFFRIGWFEYEMLRRWSLGRASAIVASLGRETTLAAATDDVIALAGFLRQHQLLRAADAESSRALARIAARAKESKLKWLLHNYLFFRVPLLRPQLFLEATAPLVAFMFTRTFAVFTVLAALLGVGLAARQWDVFAHTFVDFLSLEGLAGYAIALAIAKSIHELGHAYTAVRHGTRVAHMGVAFLVLWPMLYTDTSESWRLTDRRQRFRIAAAGVKTELALAGFATLAWSLADDGPLRSALFFLATTSWLVTIGINASPFMRFDGYFLLSDALDMPNLHARSFALARAQLRRVLFGWAEPDPEVLGQGLRRALIAFAWATWIYRFFVFLAIALAVYLLFFKLLGILLFIVEIAWFIVRPILSETKVWVTRARETRVLRALVLLVVLGGIALVVGYPWQGTVSAPGWLRASEHQVVYSPLPARLTTMKREGEVRAGELIATLDSPDTRSNAARAQVLAEALALQLDRAVGRVDGAARRALFAGELAQQVAELQAQRAELRRLDLRAPFAGRLVDAEPWVREGVWVNAKQPLAVLVGRGDWIVEGYVDARSLERVKPGARALFHPAGDALRRIEGEVVAVDRVRTSRLPAPILAASHGGPIVTVGDDQQLAPRDAIYRVRIRVPERSAQAQPVLLGVARIEAEARSLAASWWRDIAAVLVRESGF